MTLNGVMAVTLLYFNEFVKRAFQLITASSSIELIDQEPTIAESSIFGATFCRRHYRSNFNHVDLLGPQSYRIR